MFYNSSGVSHSDGSCVLGRIHSDVSSNIPKKVYHIVTDNFVNLLHISYAWLYKTECWGRKFHAFSFNSHRNCKILMTDFNFIFDTICVPYIFRKSIFGWNCDHDTPLCDTPLLEDMPLCDTPDELWCNTLKGGNPVEFTCVSFITMIMVNVSHVLCCFIVSWNKSFKRLGFCLLKVGISLILNWPLSWQMKWDTSTCSFYKVPPFNVLHHNNYFMTS